MLGSHHVPSCLLMADDLRAPSLQPQHLPSTAQALSPRVSLLELKEIISTQSWPHPRDTPILVLVGSSKHLSLSRQDDTWTTLHPTEASNAAGQGGRMGSAITSIKKQQDSSTLRLHHLGHKTPAPHQPKLHTVQSNQNQVDFCHP